MYCATFFWPANFCWKICWYSYGGSLVCNKFFSHCFQDSLLAFNFWNFNYIVLYYIFSVCLFGSLLFRILWVFLGLNVHFFPQVRKFSTIISSKKFSAPFSLFYFWNSYNVNVVCLMLSHKSLILSLLFFSFFFSLLWLGETLSSLILSSASPTLLLNPSSIPLQFCYCILQFCDFCLELSSIFFLFNMKFSLCSSILPSSMSIFRTMILNS